MGNVMPSVFSDRPRVEEIAPRIYRIDLCVPQVLGPTNSYLIKADGIHDNGRSLIIDAGSSQEITKTVFDEALAFAGVSWDAVDVFVTHLHWDHFAGLARIWRPGMTVYSAADMRTERKVPVMGAREIGLLEREVSARHGVGDVYDEEYWSPMVDAGSSAEVWEGCPSVALAEGDELAVGGYRFRVLDTPGHDMKHQCLYDERAGVFVGGDHVMESMYPSIMFESDEDQLAFFMDSTRRLAEMDASLVLCGHGSECHDLAARCRQTIEHYERQIEAFKHLCTPDITDPSELAYISTTQPRRRSWEQRSLFVRRALLGQTMAYVKHLVAIGYLPDVYELTPLR